MVNDTQVQDIDSFDDELDSQDVETTGQERSMMPPPHSDISSLFGQLEQYAESCDIGNAAFHLPKAKMSFLAAYASRPAKQTDIRTMFSKS